MVVYRRSGKAALDDLLSKYKLISVPTNAGWSSATGGSGGGALEPFRLYVNTGATASSTARFYDLVNGLNSGDIQRNCADWTKRLELNFWVARDNSDPEVAARFQLKESSSEGILAQRGIGISISNFTMVGEAYGTARGTCGLGALTHTQIARIKIVKETDRVEFWVNGVLAGTLTGSAVPSVRGTEVVYLVASIINGTTGGVDAYLLVGNIWIVQEW